MLGKVESPAKARLVKKQRDSKPLHYTVCGLDEVYLINGFTVESIEGEDYVSIEDLDGLWKAIGLHLVTMRKALAPKEIRFLRQHMGLTQAGLATKLRVTDQTVARWEKGQTDPGPADLAIRVQFLSSKLAQPEGEQLLPKLVKIFDEITHRDDTEPKIIMLERSKKKWKSDRASALMPASPPVPVSLT